MGALELEGAFVADDEKPSVSDGLERGRVAPPGQVRERERRSGSEVGDGDLMRGAVRDVGADDAGSDDRHLGIVEQVVGEQTGFLDLAGQSTQLGLGEGSEHRPAEHFVTVVGPPGHGYALVMGVASGHGSYRAHWIVLLARVLADSPTYSARPVFRCGRRRPRSATTTRRLTRGCHLDGDNEVERLVDGAHRTEVLSYDEVGTEAVWGAPVKVVEIFVAAILTRRASVWPGVRPSADVEVEVDTIREYAPDWARRSGPLARRLVRSLEGWNCYRLGGSKGSTIDGRVRIGICTP